MALHLFEQLRRNRELMLHLKTFLHPIDDAMYLEIHTLDFSDDDWWDVLDECWYS